MKKFIKIYTLLIVLFVFPLICVASSQGEKVAVICVPHTYEDAVYPIDSMKSYLHQNNVVCVEYVIDNSGSQSLQQLSQALLQEVKNLHKQYANAKIGLVTLDEACFTGMLACTQQPMDYIITINGIFSDGFDYYYDMQLLRGGINGSSEAISYRSDVYQALQCIKQGKKLENVSSAVNALCLDSPYKTSVVNYQYKEVLNELTTPLFAIFPYQDEGWHNDSQYATNIQMEMAKDKNFNYRTWIVPKFEGAKEMIRNKEYMMIYEFMQTKDNSFTNQLADKFFKEPSDKKK